MVNPCTEITIRGLKYLLVQSLRTVILGWAYYMEPEIAMEVFETLAFTGTHAMRWWRARLQQLDIPSLAMRHGCPTSYMDAIPLCIHGEYVNTDGMTEWLLKHAKQSHPGLKKAGSKKVC